MSKDHSHTHISDLGRETTRRLGLSLGITLAFVFVEIVAGIFANSLALLTDAAHNFTDVLALGLTWVALRLALRPSHSGKTFGYHRAGILVALFNSTTLVVIAGGIFYEAYRRFLVPPQVEADILIGVGIAAVVVNLVTALLVRRGSEHDLNLRSAFLHLAGDILSTAGAAAAGVAIRFTGARWLDPAVGAAIGALILWNAWGILRESLDILLEKTPADIDIDRLVADLQGLEGVCGVHDLHVWSITRSLRALSAHVLTGDISMQQAAAVRTRIEDVLCARYSISHSTLQLEHEACEPGELFCDMNHAERDAGDSAHAV
jgi:cobalt-zinc-cadmium efflux system protein